MHWIEGSRWRRAAVKIIFNLVLWQISNHSPYWQIFNLTEELWLIRWRKTFSIWPSLVTFGTDWVDLGQFGKVGEDRVGGAQGSGAAPKAVHCIALTPHLPPKPLHHPPSSFLLPPWSNWAAAVSDEWKITILGWCYRHQMFSESFCRGVIFGEVLIVFCGDV